jgi:glycerol-3-phosphate dehydrogenase
LTKAKLRYLVRRECAVSAADILWRRTKVGLRLSQAAIASVDEYLMQLSPICNRPSERGGKQGCRSFSIALGYRSPMTS